MRDAALPLVFFAIFPMLGAACMLDTEGLGELGIVGPDAAGVDSSVGADAEADSEAPSDHAIDRDDASEQSVPPDAPDEDAPCVGESDDEFCDRHGAACGVYSDFDNCGASRTADCGGCPEGTTCGGAGRPNACDWWWKCGWTVRRKLTVNSQVQLPAGYAVSFSFDHAALVAAARSLPSGDDVRIVVWDGASWAEVDRVLDPESGWRRGDTKLWFATAAPIGAGQSAAYYVFSGNPLAGPPPARERAVFAYADFFDRADDTEPGNDWILAEDSTDVTIQDGAMWFHTQDIYNRPVADAPFASIADALEWRVGLDWVRSGEEGWYRLHLQVGRAADMENPPGLADYFSNAGVGPSLLWAGTNNGMSAHEALGYEVAGAITQLTQVSGRHALRSVVSFSSRRYSVDLDGVPLARDVPFSSDIAEADRLRLMTWQVNEANFSQRAFDYVIVRRMVDPEPSLSASVFEDGACP